jgi:hypothetical protein
VVVAGAALALRRRAAGPLLQGERAADPSGVNPSYASGVGFGAGGPRGCPFSRALAAVVIAGAALSLTRRARGPLLQGERAAEPSGVNPSYASGVGFGVGRGAVCKGLPFHAGTGSGSCCGRCSIPHQTCAWTAAARRACCRPQRSQPELRERGCVWCRRGRGAQRLPLCPRRASGGCCGRCSRPDETCNWAAAARRQCCRPQRSQPELLERGCVWCRRGRGAQRLPLCPGRASGGCCGGSPSPEETCSWAAAARRACCRAQRSRPELRERRWVWRRPGREVRGVALSRGHWQRLLLWALLYPSPDVRVDRCCKASVLPTPAESSRATGAGLGLPPAGPQGSGGCPFARTLPVAVGAATALALPRRAPGLPLHVQHAAEPSGANPSYWPGVECGVGRAAGPKRLPLPPSLPAVVVATAALALTRRPRGPLLQGERAAEPQRNHPSNWSGVGCGAGPAAGCEGLPLRPGSASGSEGPRHEKIRPKTSSGDKESGSDSQRIMERPAVRAWCLPNAWRERPDCFTPAQVPPFERVKEGDKPLMRQTTDTV